MKSLIFFEKSRACSGQLKVVDVFDVTTTSRAEESACRWLLAVGHFDDQLPCAGMRVVSTAQRVTVRALLCWLALV